MNNDPTRLADLPQADRLPDEALTNIRPGDVLKTDSGERIRIGTDTPRDVFSKPQSATLATCGRVVHVYSNRWDGPRPGIVICGWGIGSGRQLINVNVMLDGANEPEALDDFRKRGQGNTLTSVGLYDPLTPQERSSLISGPGASGDENPPRYHCEWMPFQAGQATRTQAAEGDLSKRLADAEARLTKTTQAVVDLAALLKNAGPPTKNALNTVLTTLGVNQETPAP